MKEFIAKLQEAYDRGEPMVSDSEYDYLVSISPDAEKVIGKRGDTPHYKRMYSLQKYYIGKDTIPNTSGYVKTPKLDGCACSLLYVNGKLSMALTRGDGILGNNITDKMRIVAPVDINTDMPLLFITGEVINTVPVENGRNLVAGALNCVEDFERRNQELGLIFVAYGADVDMDYTQTMGWLRTLDFLTVMEEYLVPLKTDGWVYRIDSVKKFKEMGYTDKFPRGAFAVKDIPEGVVTTLLNVEWQTGGSGKITPVAILEPVDIEGAMVSRATLNNIAYIDALNLEIGCQVRVIRAGEIIPKIVERVD